MSQSNRPHLQSRSSSPPTMTIAMLAAIMGGNMSALAETDSSVVGRWRERERDPAQLGVQSIGVIDIAPCPGGYCGVTVDAKGACGAVILRLTVNPQWQGKSNGENWSNFPGILSWRGKSAPTHASWRGGSFNFTASEPGMHPLSRRSMPVYVGRFTREGPAQCDAAGVS